jgi:6-phosphogluconolactonase
MKEQKMTSESWITVSMAAMLAFVSATVFADDNSGHDDDGGAVYTMTNDNGGNQILMFDRGGNGALRAVGAVATNGIGSGGGVDPLGSQHSLVLSEDEHWLIAVNAGSNEISVMRVLPHNLQLSYTTGSGGTFPVSVAVFHDLVYVLNAGAAPNITGFKLEHNGRLTPLANSTRMLGASTFGEVGFDVRGETLLVTDKANSKIIAFAVDEQDLPATGPVVSPSNGKVPFGFTFDRHDHLLVVEAGSDAVSSYTVDASDTLQTISSSVANGQKAACWIATNRRNYVFTANPGSHTISSYTLNAKTGDVTLQSASTGAVTAPLDIAMTRSGRFLYALDVGSLQIDAFQVEQDGSLTNLGPVPGGFSQFAQGMAVR